MALFYDMKNKYISLTIDVIDMLHEQGSVSSLALQDVFSENINDTYLDSILEYPVFEKIPKKMAYRLALDTPIPIRFTRAEKIWLKGILHDPKIAIFLSSEERGRLLDRLKAVPDYSTAISSKSLAEFPDKLTQVHIQKIQILLDAIVQRRFVSFSNRTKTELYKNEHVIPYRLEYSITEEVFRLSFWKDRPLKANIQRICEITVGERIPQSELKTIYEVVQIRKAPEPIRLRVKNEKQAIERMAMLFSNCKRKVTPVYDTDGGCLVAHEVELEYYLFEEEEIIQKILSFGPTVQVFGNAGVVERIRKILMEA